MLHTTYLALALAAFQLADARSILQRGKLNMIPMYPYDPETIKTCAWWLDNDGTWTCPEVQETFGLSMTDFQRWNPAVAMPCDLLPKEQSFCIAATDARQAIQTITVEVTASGFSILTETVTVQSTVSGATVVTAPITIPVTVPIPVTTIQTTTATVTTTVLSVPTPQRGNNGLTTPVPYQPGMVNNCKTFYLVQDGDTCVNIAARFRIGEDQIVAWNPEARNDCTHLLANNYCCVGVL